MLAFLRSDGATAAITIVPVRARALLGDNDIPFVPAASWGDTAVTLPPERAGRQWRNALTGEVVSAMNGSLNVAEVLGQLPVALLVAG